MLEPKFGENICFDVLNFYVSKVDDACKDKGMSQAAWDEVLKHHMEKPEHAKKVASNIVINILATEEMVKDFKVQSKK